MSKKDKFYSSSELLENLINKDVSKNIKKIYNEVDKNDEFELSFYNYKNKESLSYKNYVSVLKYLSMRKKRDSNLKLDKEISLDIIFSDFSKKSSYRLSIKTEDGIKKYLSLISNKRNDVVYKLILSKFINKDKNIELIKKVRSDKNIIDITDFDLRVRKLKELNVSKEELSMLKKINNNNLNNIIFRKKHRVSLILLDKDGKKIRIDLTDTKTSNKIRNLQNISSKYELELEFLSNKKKNGIEYLNKLMNETSNLLKVLNESYFLIKNSTKEKLLDKYCDLFSLNKDNKNKIRFKGRQVSSLEIQHVVDILPNSYAVTDKADGERRFLIIFDGNVYLISTNMNITNTGIKLKNNLSKYNDTILDGEFIYLKKHNRHLFMVFDCLFSKGESLLEENDFMKRLSKADDVIKNCFILDKQKGHNFSNYNGKFNIEKVMNFHNNELSKFINSLDNDLYIEKKYLLVRRKYFIPVIGGSDNEIFKYSNLLYNKLVNSGDKTVPFELDGLIYHPTMNLKQVEYKFKPPDQNSIDFYITFERDPITNKILTLFDNSNESIVENKEYRICNLHVGKVIKGVEIPILFNEQNKRHIAHLPITNNIVKDLEGNIISDKTVVEFYYDLDSTIQNDKFRWKPIRTRYDKTESVNRYKKKYGNYTTVADSVWRSIINPFTFDDIKQLSDDSNYKKKINNLRSKIDRKLISSFRKQNEYYQFQSKIGTIQRKFHNWIKDMLIQTYCSPIDGKKLDVLGIAEGRGGDIMKFYYAKVNFMLATDVSSDVIESTTDGWLSRYRTLKKKKYLTNFPKMVSIQADATVKFDYESQKKKIINMSKINENLMKKYFNDNKMKFDRLNCQFALHYFLKDEFSWKNFTDNINEYLKVDGYAIFTCFDGDIIYNLLKEKNRYESNYNDNTGTKRTFFHILKKYNNSKNNKINLGYAIDVNISSFMSENSYQTEYLVSYDFIVDELKQKCNLELVDSCLFSDVYKINKNYFENTIKYEDNLQTKKFLENVSDYYKDMNDETKASFNLTKLNRYYVFRKSSKNKNITTSKLKQKENIKSSKGGSKYINEIDKYLGNKFKCKIKSWEKNSYLRSIHSSLLKSSFIENNNYKNFYDEMNINLLSDKNINNDSIKKINSKLKIKNNKIKISGINTLILEKNNDEFYISGYGKKDRIVKSNPTLILYKENDSYLPIFKNNTEKNIYTFKTDGTFIKKLFKKYNIS